MSYQRIHIIGGPGSGKSTLAHALSQTFDLPVFGLDHVFAEDTARLYEQETPSPGRQAKLDAITCMPAWIIEGADWKWIDRVFQRAEVIIILSVSVWRRDWRIMRRSVRWYYSEYGLFTGQTLVKLPYLYQDLRWNHQYDCRELVHVRQELLSFQDKVVEAQSPADVLSTLRSCS